MRGKKYYLYLTNRKLSEFVGGKVNFLSILAVCSSTAGATFFDLYVHLCHDRNNGKMPACCFSCLVSDQQSVDLKSSLLKK